jgi:hypothetical protein
MWLAEQGLSLEYCDAMMREGYDELALLLDLGQGDLQELVEAINMRSGHALKLRRALGLGQLHSIHPSAAPSRVSPLPTEQRLARPRLDAQVSSAGPSTPSVGTPPQSPGALPFQLRAAASAHTQPPARAARRPRQPGVQQRPVACVPQADPEVRAAAGAQQQPSGAPLFRCVARAAATPDFGVDTDRPSVLHYYHVGDTVVLHEIRRERKVIRVRQTFHKLLYRPTLPVRPPSK